MSYEKVVEPFPLFIRRAGDWVAEGGNNTLIVLGSDRIKKDGPATGDDGHGNLPGAGSITMVVGRKDQNKGHPQINSDDVTFYMSRKCDVDANVLSENLVSKKDGTFANASNAASAILSADEIRIPVGSSIKIFLSDTEHIVLAPKICEIHMGSSFVCIENSDDAKQITVNSGDVDVIIDGKGNKIKLGNIANAMSKLVDIFANIGVISNIGNLGAHVPINPMLVQKLNDWKAEYIQSNEFIKMNEE